MLVLSSDKCAFSHIAGVNIVIILMVILVCLSYSDVFVLFLL